MRSKKYSILTIIIDLFSFAISWSVFYALRIESGYFEFSIRPDFLLPMIVMIIYWFIIFTLFGLYRSWHAKSRIDEFVTALKAISIGSLIFFMMISFEDSSIGSTIKSRSSMIIYWGILTLIIGFNRFIYRSIIRKLLKSGIGLENTLIIGNLKLSKKLFDEIKKFPLLGFNVIGIISLEKKIDKYVIGHLNQLEKLIKKNKAENLIIALESTHHKTLLEIISKTPTNVSLKIIPDMYDIISGQARTNQLYGFPLIEIMPSIMQPWEIILKRFTDILISILILIITFPICILIAIVIKMDSKGKIIFSQERVGKDGKIFFMKKFRTMIHDAEKNTGPIWSTKTDSRITKIGKFLRRTRLDEIPQFLNVLKGEMSLVGPRPERSFFVERLKKEIPLYIRRQKVKPGITGWAQIKQGYDESIDDVRSKVKFDLYYIENISIRMDLKILMMTFYTMLRGRGQ